MTAVGEHDVLWQRYWKDFVANRFHLNAGEDKLTFEVLNLTIAHPMARQNVRTKLVALHSTAYTNQINLAKLISSLRPLQMLVPAMPLVSRDPCTTFMSMLDQRPDHVHHPEALYQFIIDTLFSALAENCLKCDNEDMNYYEPEKLEVWRECYRDVVCKCVCCMFITYYVCVLYFRKTRSDVVQCSAVYSENICYLHGKPDWLKMYLSKDDFMQPLGKYSLASLSVCM